MLYAHVENGVVTYRENYPFYPVDELWENYKYNCNELLVAA